VRSVTRSRERRPAGASHPLGMFPGRELTFLDVDSPWSVRGVGLSGRDQEVALAARERPGFCKHIDHSATGAPAASCVSREHAGGQSAVFTSASTSSPAATPESRRKPPNLRIGLVKSFEDVIVGPGVSDRLTFRRSRRPAGLSITQGRVRVQGHRWQTGSRGMEGGVTKQCL